MAEDSNIRIGFPNRVDGAFLSGGAWTGPLPLDNLKDRLFSRVARSVDVDPSSTRFEVDFGRQRSIQIIALIAHNLSFSARVRIRASDQSNFSALLYDKTQDAWGSLVDADWDINTLEWENDNYWAGTFTQEETEGQTAVSSFILDEPISARYWSFDIIDPQNVDGFVDIGRVFIGDGFLNPDINMAYGASLGYETDTVVEKALGGAEFFDPRESLRVMRFSLPFMSEEEGFGRALELTRRAGIHREVFVVADPTDEIFGPQRNFLGRLRQLSPLEQAMFQLTSMSFEIKELR